MPATTWTALRSVPPLLAALACMLPLWPVMTGAYPPPFQCLLAGVAVLAFVAPAEGLLAVAGLFPLSAMLGILLGLQVPHVGLTIVLAYLVGWCCRRGFEVTPRVSAPFFGPLLVLGTAVVSSAAVNSAIAMAGEGLTVAGMLQDVQGFIANYIDRSNPDHPWFAAANLLTQLMVFYAVTVVVADDSLQTRRLLRVSVLSVTGAAALNVSRFTQGAIASGEPLRAAQAYLGWLRINIHYADLNAAASVFAMVLLVAVGIARTSGRWRWLWGGCVLVVAVAMWLAGSRAAIAALLVGISVAALWEHRARTRGAALVAVVMVTTLLIAAGILWKFPRQQANIDPGSALEIRHELVLRAARMFRDQPVFGIGAGRFYFESDRYATSGSGFGRENAHNDLMQIAAELGAVGLAAFLWLLWAVGRPLLRGGPPAASRSLRIWVTAGLGAYLASGMAGHPLIVYEAAIPFWFVLGAAAHFGARCADRGHSLRAGGLLALVVLLCLPFRLQSAYESQADPGSSIPWQTDGGVAFRDVGHQDTIVLRPPVSAVVIPLRTTGPEPHGEVEISVDGQVVNRVDVAAARWSAIRFKLPNREGHDDRHITLTLVGAPPGVRLLVGRATPISARQR